MTGAKVYDVHVSRDGCKFEADVPGLPGAHTWAWLQSDLMRYIREAIILADDLPDDAVVTMTLTWEDT